MPSLPGAHVEDGAGEGVREGTEVVEGTEGTEAKEYKEYNEQKDKEARGPWLMAAEIQRL